VAFHVSTGLLGLDREHRSAAWFSTACVPVETAHSRVARVSPASISTWTFDAPFAEVFACVGAGRFLALPWNGRIRVAEMPRSMGQTAHFELETSRYWTPFYYRNVCPKLLFATWTVDMEQTPAGTRVSVLPVRYEVQGPPTRPRHQWGAAIAVHPNFFESHLVLLGIGECLGEESVPPVDMPDTHAAPASCFE
jgi:hypothetical protein